MSWHYSRALGVAYSAGHCSDGHASAPLKRTSMRVVSLWPDSKTEACLRSLYGMTCALSTVGPGVDWWISSLAASRVRTSAPQEKAPESPGSEVDFGKRWPESLAKYDPTTSLWRTHQCSLFGGLESFSETWPRWGIMRAGECWALTTSEHLTSETESGFWPTPRATEREGLESGRNRQSPTLSTVVRSPNLWPTPCASEARQGYQDRNNGKKGQESLSTVVQGGPSHLVGGSLNPTWVEWLMGWPLGWTDCDASATDRFRQWLHSHGTPSTSCGEPVTT